MPVTQYPAFLNRSADGQGLGPASSPDARALLHQDPDGSLGHTDPASLAPDLSGYATTAYVGANFSPVGHTHDDRYYTQPEVDALIAAVEAGEGGAIAHSALTGLDYASSGHTGFSPAGHTHDDLYSPLGHDHDADYSPVGHNHDERYYTETEVDDLIAAVPVGVTAHGDLTGLDYASSGHTGFAPAVHNHDGVYSPVGHNHDAAYSPLGHNHVAADVTDLDDVLATYATVAYVDAAFAPLVHNHDDRYYTESEVDSLIAGVGGGGGVTEHSDLTQLDYASSGHTGFAPEVHTHDDRYYTETEADTLIAAAGSGKILKTPATSTDNVIRPSADARCLALQVFTDAAGSRVFDILREDGTRMISVHKSGRLVISVGADTPVPSQPLEVHGAEAAVYINHTGSRVRFTLRANGVTAYLVNDTGTFSIGPNTTVHVGNLNYTAAGNLGLGVTVPTEKLEVAGNVKHRASIPVPVVHAYAAGDATAKTVDWASGQVHLLASRTGNTVSTISNVPEGGHLELYQQQDATGGRTLTFTNTINWTNTGTTTPPTIGSTAGKTQHFIFKQRPFGLGLEGTYVGEA